MNVTQTLGWALLHSVWQCAFAASTLASLLAIVPVRAARTRYAFAVATLILMLAAPIGTGVRLRTAPVGAGVSAAVASVPRGVASPTRPGTGPEAPPARLPTALATRVRAGLEPALPWIVVAWFAGVVILSIRLASGWLVTRSLSTVGTRPVPQACRDALARLVVRLRVTRPVQVLESAVVQVPAVIGWLRPVVLLPASALTGLTPLQLDALLAHELAHVRRYDYLVNLLQIAIETLLFYHPAVWWVSRRVRDEREHCCDDVAVAACGDAHFYAAALLGMERLRSPLPVLSFAATGGSLVGRVRRLMTPVPAELFPRGIAAAIAVTIALVVAGAGLARSPDAAGARNAQAPSAALAGAPRDPHAGRDLVRVLRRRGDQQAVTALLAIAHQDGDVDVQQSAVEALGKIGSGAAVAAVIDVARTHPDDDVRREAVETLGHIAPRSVALDVLAEVVRNDRDHHVQHEAVEELGELRDRRAFPVLLDFARHHPAPDVRRKAVSALARAGEPDSTASVLEQMALHDSSAELQHEAVEALGRLDDPRALARVARLARTHASPDVRDEATEQYAKHAPPDAAVALLTDRLAHDAEPDVQAEAVEQLAALPRGAGIPAVIEAARSHAIADVRAEAWRRLRESDDPRARAFVRRTSRP